MPTVSSFFRASLIAFVSSSLRFEMGGFDVNGLRVSMSLPLVSLPLLVAIGEDFEWYFDDKLDRFVAKLSC